MNSLSKVGCSPDCGASADPLAALSSDLYGGAKRATVVRILVILFVTRGNWKALVLIRLIQWSRLRERAFIGNWASTTLRREFGCFVQPGATIGPGLRLPHPNGIVIGSGAHIGAGCTIYHQVTLGGARKGDWQANRYPQVGDNAMIFAGAKLLGAITVGEGAVIGANAVVNRDVPAHHVAIGSPAICRPLATKSDQI